MPLPQGALRSPRSEQSPRRENSPDERGDPVNAPPVGIADMAIAHSLELARLALDMGPRRRRFDPPQEVQLSPDSPLESPRRRAPGVPSFQAWIKRSFLAVVSALQWFI